MYSKELTEAVWCGNYYFWCPYSQPVNPKITYSTESIADDNPNKVSKPVTPSLLSEWITL
jgi:hypothetical protein